MNRQDENEVLSRYQTGLSRRDSLKWFSVLAAGSVLASAGCSSLSLTSEPNADTGHWPQLDIQPITAKGYGKDPNLILPPASPWPLTLTAEQLSLVAVLSDYIAPREGNIPSASEVKVPDVIDEWVSAPYDDQQRDRITILHALAWIDDESRLRFDKPFTMLAPTQQVAILDDIAWNNEQTPAAFQRIAKAFDRFKGLVLAAFFCSPEGSKDIGYLGNVPIAGDYPGPTNEAMAHLNAVLAELNLTSYAYQG